MDESDPFYPFSVSAIWTTQATDLNEDEHQPALFAPFIADIPTIKLDNPYAPSKTLSEELVLPKLESLELHAPEDITASDGSVFSFGPEQDQLAIDDEYDIWDDILEVEVSDQGKKLYSWEAFADINYKEPGPVYISEAGPDAFDAALQHTCLATPDKLGHALSADVLFQSLLALGLGRSSRFFMFKIEQSKFEQVIEGTRMPGYSLESSQDFVFEMMRSGNAVKFLRRFAERVYEATSPAPGLVALARAVETILSAFEAHITERAPTLRSFLQLESIFVQGIEALCSIEAAVRGVEHVRTDEELLSLLFTFHRGVEEQSNGLRSLFRQIFRDVARPWLEKAGMWAGLGLQQQYATGSDELEPAFVKTPKELPDNGVRASAEVRFEPANLPSPISEDLGERLFEIGRSLRLLRTHHSEHPLCDSTKQNNSPPKLDLAFNWDDVHRITTEAASYEQSLATAVLHYQDEAPGLSRQRSVATSIMKDTARSTEGEFSPVTWDQFANDILEGPSAYNSSAPTALLPNQLHELTLSALNNEITDPDYAFHPELSLAPTLSFSPLLTAQARLVYAATLRLFFRSHHLRAHLELQHEFHLLGNGSFVTKITSALFDPERATAERKRGVMRTGEQMGLRLGTRSTWPPASSELQLALMGILSDCYGQSKISTLFGKSQLERNERGDIPGNLSFAVRQLPPEEVEKCMDPDSLYALDFLRLQYSPPSPLGAIITPASLERYDAIFKALLRLLRMLFVVEHLPRRGLSLTQQKFRLEVTHFVSASARYFFDAGVRDAWAAFSKYLASVERRLEKEDETESLGRFVSEGLDDLRKAHERCLDQIMFSLLLRKRQVQVMALLEEIFGVVLSFAKTCAAVPVDRITAEEELSKLRDTFKSKVTVFLNVCRGLIGKKGYGKVTNWDGNGSMSGEDNTIDRLLLALEMNGYYGSHL
ncbi:hypothetical protein NA57DRAFT_35241 [Rhizodiscina lignyota]|uniref:Spindle pole body component n=1 Tax=Rhizodiscina lignyota TaxID=1504668 RepID=A0A9P4IMV4_9PEZI|nr:hypothetical protein NA57DRAFT_35241 [Rhizodiscina lignyota]